MKILRFVTAASLFDGHDVSINIMRRILQSKGVEVIHLGHNRSALDVVDAALCEDADAVAISSYQGGHMEYFKYVRQLLNENGGAHIKIFGGGGGVITPKEIALLESQGIDKIYSPKDGMKLGLEGIIDDMIHKARLVSSLPVKEKSHYSKYELAQIISIIENTGEIPVKNNSQHLVPVLGITGTGGAGKSSLIDELLIRFARIFPQKKLALLSIDPTKKKTQGALLGDRIRLGDTTSNHLYVRSLATRTSGSELSPQTKRVVDFLKGQDFDFIIVETSGIGQASDAITHIADKCLYVMTPEYGAATQLEKIEMLETADFIALNKFEKARSEDALRDITKQYKRNHKIFEAHSDNAIPIYATMASRFNDLGVNALFKDMMQAFGFENDWDFECQKSEREKKMIIPAQQIQYLQNISDVVRKYNQNTAQNMLKLKKFEAYSEVAIDIQNNEIIKIKNEVKESIDAKIFELMEHMNQVICDYQKGVFTYSVRDKKINVKTKYESLSHSLINIVALPKFSSIADEYSFFAKENLPGFFPFAAGIFPFKRKDEEPKRQFAGEGGPLRTNKRFHYLCQGDESKRLSTAFDSVTLYGEDPAVRPDIFGKIGESGVSIATLTDMKDLFQGFDLTDSKTSVSKTINGPAAIILAMFMNAAIEQKLEGADLDDTAKRIAIMQSVRGTVQADILKEDQAQNTCIFSLEFALKLMGDVQEYFYQNKIKNYYTVSISGYHIAEAGANPITQLALTLSNGFTYVEYYLSRGMKIDDFAENLSFFFSNGLDPEYSVIGRVARKIWAVTMRDKYGASEKSQKLKYHIQTSGRSLHAQEIDFNDIRTTLQAFLALSDNCNSLHTNAYDEAITTPTEESVRRAMAIQMIINREFGLNKSDNPMQGSFLLNELCDIVEEAVLKEFEAISAKGGVLGAMESQYQRGKIQDESHHYEMLKDSGELPIIGVNTYISPNVEADMNKEIELSRATDQEKNEQIERLQKFQKNHEAKSALYLKRLEEVALRNENIFAELMHTTRYCSLGQITQCLYKVGGRYRRNV